MSRFLNSENILDKNVNDLFLKELISDLFHEIFPHIISFELLSTTCFKSTHVVKPGSDQHETLLRDVIFSIMRDNNILRGIYNILRGIYDILRGIYDILRGK